MGSHASILNKKEIWTLVHYVRQFQDEDYGKTPVETAAEGEENENEENAEVVEANEAAPAH